MEKVKWTGPIDWLMGSVVLMKKKVSKVLKSRLCEESKQSRGCLRVLKRDCFTAFAMTLNF